MSNFLVYISDDESCNGRIWWYDDWKLATLTDRCVLDTTANPQDIINKNGIQWCQLVILHTTTRLERPYHIREMNLLWPSHNDHLCLLQVTNTQTTMLWIQVSLTTRSTLLPSTHCTNKEPHKPFQLVPIRKMGHDSDQNIRTLLLWGSTNNRNIFHLRVILINVVTRLAWPLLIIVQQKSGPSSPPLRSHHSFTIKATWRIICWIHVTRNKVPLRRRCIFSDESNSVCYKSFEPSLLIPQITQHRCAIGPKHTLLQREIKFSLKLNFNSDCQDCRCKLHAWNSELLQRSNSALPKHKWTVNLTSLILKTQIRDTTIAIIAGIGKMMKLSRGQSSETLWQVTPRYREGIQV